MITCDFCGEVKPEEGADMACGGQGKNVACAECVEASDKFWAEENAKEAKRGLFAAYDPQPINQRREDNHRG